jgi:tetratricopeptide (TPR) repeat protein
MIEDGTDYGAVMQNKREAMNWTRARLAAEYGRALGEDIKEETIRIYEQRNTLPTKHLNRRAMLAGLLGLTPMALGIVVPPKVAPKLVVPAVEVEAPVDMVGYRWALARYWRQGADGALEDVARRIVCLHNQVLYVGGKDQQERVRLLCGFNTVAGGALNALGFPENAASYHAKAIRLAHEKEQYDLEGFARWRRASELLDRGAYNAALRDLRRAKLLEKKLPKPLNGYVTSLLGKACAFTAQDSEDVAEAMAFADEAERAIGEQMGFNSDLLRFDRVRYVLDLSLVFVAPPSQSLHLPNETIKLIGTEVPFFDETRSEQYRQIHCTLIQARAYLDKKDYAYAATLLIDVLAIMEELHSVIQLPDVEALYHRLKETSYTNSVEVARLSLALTQVKYPELFW